MERVNNQKGDPVYYLLHHAVCGKRLRVVFSGEALHGTLQPGPKLRTEITTILTRWRQHKFVFTVDIVEMFTQIRVHSDDKSWQRLW